MRLADLDPRETVLLDPPTRVNFNVPNFALLFAASQHGFNVIDQHVLPFPRDRVLRSRHPTVVVSARPHTRAEAGRVAARLAAAGRRCLSLRGPVDVQCCYPFVAAGPEVEHDVEFSDALPLPRHELFDSCNYQRTNWRAGLWPYPLLSSVGCPYGCAFCAARRRRWRTRSPEHCAEELRRAVRWHGIRRFELLDDVFNLRTERVERFCELVAPLGLRWSCANGLRADRFDARQARALAAAGCDQVGFGVESVDPAVLAAVDKGESMAQLEAAVALAHQHFPVVFGYFIIGLPGATFESDMAGLRWARERGVVPNHSFHVPDRERQGEAFFGAGARPLSDAYPRTEQRRVYRAARELKGAQYHAQHLLLRALIGTARALPRYRPTSLLNHALLSGAQLLGLIKRGELQ